MTAGLAVLAPPPAQAGSACVLSARDRAEITAIISTYRQSWLEGDRRGVLATFAAEPVLMPPDTARPRVGREATTAFWWPAGGTPSRVTRLDISIDDLRGDCRVAYARGLDRVEWVTEGDDPSKPRGNTGAYLNVMQRFDDGWKIVIHMWNDDPQLRH